MSAWLDATPTIGASVAGFGDKLSILSNNSDPLLQQIKASRKALQLVESRISSSNNNEEKEEEEEEEEKEKEGNDNSEQASDSLLVQFFESSCNGDLVTMESILRTYPEFVDRLYPLEQAGVTALVFAICFSNEDIAESLLQNHNANPDLADTLVNYTPLMWAVHLNQLDMVELLLKYQADPFLSPEKSNKNAVKLINPENYEMVEYFRSHNLLGKANTDSEDYYKINTFIPQDEFEDDILTKLKLHSLSGTVDEDRDGEREGIRSKYDQDTPLGNEDDESVLALDINLARLPEFDYKTLQSEQYIQFTDSDIPSLINYMFDLRLKTTYQHETKFPAAILFQLVRYAFFKLESVELSEFLFDCFTARLRTVTNTKSGAFNMALQDNESAYGAGDIVLLSYWLSSLQFLHFYFSKSNIYKHFPQFLQEIINLIQSLIATLSFSINSRLNLLVDQCILNFTSLIDVSNTLYAKDWNLFKKNKSHPNNYDDILATLYPPTQEELMKPSPIKYTQVLGALGYVLKIHKVDNLFRMQTYSQVFYYINCVIFNSIISLSRYCTRSKAVQIRLNLSSIEDWLRSHNFQCQRPEHIGGLQKLIRGTNMGQEEVQTSQELHNLLIDTNPLLPKKNPQCLEFYYDSLFHVCKYQLQPMIELLQWLQCMSSLSTEESLINTINQFDSINYYQLLKVSNKLYKYEVHEPRLPKPLVSFIKSLVNERGEEQVANCLQHYMTQSTFLSKERFILLNPNYIYGVALPNLTELISNYGSGIGGTHILRGKKYQPSLPIKIIDDIDEILAENRSMEEKDEYTQATPDDYSESEDLGEVGEGTEQESKNPVKEKSSYKDDGLKGDELFKHVQKPYSLAHREWGDSKNDDFETNPW